MRAITSNRRNDIRLLTYIDGEPVSNFRLREFENADGLAMVHPMLLEALERTRKALCERAGETVWLMIADAVRTQQDLERIAARLGWTDEGGKVARDSKHLARHGGIAVDLIAVIERTRVRIPQSNLGEVCRNYFDFVKDDYADGHVHADVRSRARRIET